MDNILKTVVDLAGGGHSDRRMSPLSVLYGYAKLASMADSVLDSLFSEGDERDQVTKIQRMMFKSDINFVLLKDSYNILTTQNKTRCSKKAAEVINAIQEGSDEYSAQEVLEILSEEKLPEFSVLVENNSIDDVFKYLNEAEKKEQARSKKPKQRKKDTETAPDTEEQSETDEEFQSKRSTFRDLQSLTNRLQEGLLCKVKGQDEAVRIFTQGFFESEVLGKEREDKGVAASFLFAGPPGVGKTYLAMTASEILDRPFMRFDMSEYNAYASDHRLIGSPKTFKAADKGRLTSFVKDNPKCIVLFDEIEKASPEVIHLFLQVLDEGVITDAYTEKPVWFYDTILIFTTNAGKSLYEDETRENLSSVPPSVVRKALEENTEEEGVARFPTAIVSRFSMGNIVMFNRLPVHRLVDIANEGFRKCTSKLNKLYGYDIEIDDKLASMLLFNQGASIDARNIAAHSEKMIKAELREFGRHMIGRGPDNNVFGELERLHFRLEIPEQEEIKSLFYDTAGSEVLYLGVQEDIADAPIGEHINFSTVSSREDALKAVAENEISVVIIDPLFNPVEGQQDYLSLDDRKSEGIYAFEDIRKSFSAIPVYFTEKNPILDADKHVLLEKGARGFINSDDRLLFAEKVTEICKNEYLQKRVNDICGRGRALTYDSKEIIYNDGKDADLVYYDFSIRMATDAGENGMMLSEEDRPKERFADVIGAENAKNELKFFVDYMKSPKKFMSQGVNAPKGILLYGPPGTGKTKLARAMAGECDATFFESSATDFADKFVGESEKKIRELFRVARKYAPSVIFIDEIDAIGKERTGDSSTHHTELQLNTLLTEMGGFNTNPDRPVFVIAATNFDLDGKAGKASHIDKALERRFDNRIYVDLPKEKERELYLRRQRDKNKLTGLSDDAIHSVAQRTTGDSLAIMENVLNLAIRNARKEGRDVQDDDLFSALEEYRFGTKKIWDEKYFRATAFHESGHAYVCYLSGEKPSYVTIASRGDFGGYMQHANEEEIPSYTREQLLWKIRTSLAGRAAELEFYGEEEGVTTGASGDLSKATNLAMSMFCDYGMSDDGLISISKNDLLNSPMGEKLIENVNALLDREMKKTRELIAGGKDKITALAEYLIENTFATESEIVDILS